MSNGNGLAGRRRSDGARIAVIGSGYVGLTLAACLAHFGHQVECTDRSEARVERLSAGEVPIVEDGLTDVVQETVRQGRLRFDTDNRRAVAESDFVFLCLPTPHGADGQADLSFVLDVAEEIGPHVRSGAVVITKSTVPVGTATLVASALGRRDVHVVSNPEFLAEGTAVQDCLHPDRIVVGADSEPVARRVADLYGPESAARSVLTDIASAELIKYASNAYLATRLTFVNAMAELCERVGADIGSVTAGMGLDHRIGGSFLQAGPGWGGSCFPKDTRALVHTADAFGCDLAVVKAAIASNADHTARIVDKVTDALDGVLRGRRIALWGLTFKAGTDDLRESPAMTIAQRLLDLGASVHAYDPTVEEGTFQGIEVHASPLSAATGASALLVATEWPEFAAVDLAELGAVMAGGAVMDARRMLDAAAVSDQGLVYHGLGTGQAQRTAEFAA
jgi:UDPglucose 6-dehydrogenase